MGKHPSLSDRLDELSANIEHDRDADVNLSFGVTNFTPPSFFLDTANDLPTLSDDSGEYGGVGLENDIHKYSDEGGLPELKEQIKQLWLENDRFEDDVPTKRVPKDDDPEDREWNIVVTCGAQSAIYIALAILLDNDDKALTIEPHYPYHAQTNWLLTLEEPATVGAGPEDGFVPAINDVKNKVEQEDVKAIVLCSPSNPTGTTYDPKFLEKVAGLVRENPDVAVVTDETYAFFTYGDNTHHRIASYEGMEDHCITIGTFSKLLGITGWRLGFMVVPEHLYEEGARRLNDNINIHPPTVTQAILAEALAGIDEFDHVDCWVDELASRRDVLIEPFRKSDKMEVHEPEGAYYLLPKIKEDAYDDLSDLPKYEDIKKEKKDKDEKVTAGECLQRHLLEEANVQVQSGTQFGADPNIRLAYGETDSEVLEQAADDIADALAEF